MSRDVYFVVSNMSNIGGTQRVTQVLANYFVNFLGYKVTIINIGIKNNDEKFQLDSKIKLHYCESVQKKNKILSLLDNYIKFKKKVKELDINNSIIISMGMGFSYMLPFAMSKKNNNKLIGMQHSVFRSNKIIDIIRRGILKKLNVFIAINEAMKEDTSRKLKLKNLCCIENPLSFETMEQSNLKNRRVIAVGRLSEEKGFDMLVDIWNIVNKKLPYYKLSIIGEGNLKVKLKEKINIYKLENSILMEGAKLDIVKEYKNADLCLNTSKYEGFGLTLIEAHSCGVPTITFNCSPCIENIVKNGNGIIIPGYNIKQYANQIIKLLTDKEKLYFMSENAKKSSANYKIDIIGAKWEKVFNNINL
ncbi:MAG: glycosyltransferase [Clostridium sp.]